MLDTRNINRIILTKYFWLYEFECPCCRALRLHPALLEAIQRLRVKIGSPIVIKSGFRCTRHNQDVGGKHGSHHLFGMAVDIRHESWGIDWFVGHAKVAGFKGIQFNPEGRYWHLDVRLGKPWVDVPDLPITT